MAAQAQLVGAFLVRDGRVLLGLRSSAKTLCPDTWDCIGGHVEAGETPEAALRRELLEEIGVAPTKLSFLTEVADTENRCGLYRVDGWEAGEPRLTNDEHVDLRWFTADEAFALPNLALEQYRAIFHPLCAT